MSVWEEMVRGGGGKIEGRFITEPGVMILSKTEITPEASALFAGMGLSEDVPSYVQNAEFAARLTYLQFPTTPEKSEGYMKRMVEEHGHLSVFAATTVTFLIAGVSAEAALELAAHKEASVARLTSSRTKAQDVPYYALSGTDKELDRMGDYLSMLEFERGKILHDPLSPDDREMNNRLLPSKAVALTFTMNLKDYHKTFIGRLSHHGVEAEMRHVCERMCRHLHELYPLVIREPSWYYERNNASKYEIE